MGDGEPTAAAWPVLEVYPAIRRVTVLILDEQPAVRAGLHASLRREDGFDVVGEAVTGEEALERALDLQPDVLLMDVILPDRSGVDVIRVMRGLLPEVRIVVLTALADDRAAQQAMRAGAAAYVLKDAPLDELRQSIRLVTSDRVRLPNWIAAPARPERPFGITVREHEVLAQLAEGKTNKEIARELAVTQETAKTYVKRVLAKLGVENRTEAAIVAISSGLARPCTHWSG
jgi:DNA-binding NarL/FixJ family response regulator